MEVRKLLEHKHMSTLTNPHFWSPYKWQSDSIWIRITADAYIKDDFLVANQLINNDFSSAKSLR